MSHWNPPSSSTGSASTEQLTSRVELLVRQLQELLLTQHGHQKRSIVSENRLRVSMESTYVAAPNYTQDIAPGDNPFKKKESEFKRDSPYAQ
jgi:hypothetical protein